MPPRLLGAAGPADRPAYAATVEVDGPNGAELVDARSSDALNLAALTAEAVLMRRALAARPMTIEKAEP
jgi:bifunctional DNase/RNase